MEHNGMSRTKTNCLLYVQQHCSNYTSPTWPYGHDREEKSPIQIRDSWVSAYEEYGLKETRRVFIHTYPCYYRKSRPIYNYTLDWPHPCRGSLYESRSQWPRGLKGVGLRPLACRDCGFESRWWHGHLSVVTVACCQVEVSATSWSLVQRSPTDSDASLCVI